ncbi:uncharacterized protein LOC141598735 [Silene latifolia]|uniref:uncharacterized protein LOC141598735 n=1 Tax=Silene latifolia TaxID=37657 RepID=UPI003D77D9C5
MISGVFLCKYMAPLYLLRFSDLPVSTGSFQRQIAASLIRPHRAVDRNGRALQPMSPASYSSFMEGVKACIHSSGMAILDVKAQNGYRHISSCGDYNYQQIYIKTAIFNVCLDMDPRINLCQLQALNPEAIFTSSLLLKKVALPAFPAFGRKARDLLTKDYNFNHKFTLSMEEGINLKLTAKYEKKKDGLNQQCQRKTDESYQASMS